MDFVTLHTLDGRDVLVNPPLIVTLGEARDAGDPAKQLTDKVHCVVSLIDGKFVTVVESCERVRQRLRDMR